MKFLALGLLMFLQAGSADKMQQSEQQWMQQNWHHDGNSVTYETSTGKIYQYGKEWIPISGGGPPLHCYSFSKANSNWEVVNDSVCKSKMVSIDDGVTPGGKQLFAVPRDWDCRVFNDGPEHNTLMGVVCTKPKQK
jgi:hypothetical protein